MARQSQRILVVDDWLDWRITLSNLLTARGYDVQVAASLEGALTALKSCSFDLAVVDIRLDDPDESNTQGLELAGIIKRDWPAVKVVIVTGYSNVEMVQQALEPRLAGLKAADAYIEKNAAADLAETVERLLAT